MAGNLYELAEYPGLIPSASVRDRVHGEVYRADDLDVWHALDAYEGCGPEDPAPHEFERAIVDVTMDDGRVLKSATYLYRGAVSKDLRIASGDFFDRSPHQVR